MRNNNQLRRLGVALIALVIIFAFMTTTARERTQTTLVEKSIATVLYPLQTATDWVAQKFRGVGQSIRELSNLRQEDAILREKVQQSAQLDSKNQMLLKEIQALRSELQMKEHSPYPLLTAQVIARTPENWYRTVTINRGSREGVQPNMAVVNWQGLVGKVSLTTPFTSTVQLVVDAGFGQSGFGAGAKLPTGELGIVDTVQGGFVRMKFFSGDPAARVGQPVFTSGQAVLPPGLLIGYVDGLNTGESGTDKYLNVRPAVDFHKLDVLQVVLYSAGNDLEKDRGANAP
jgi:rod shape-determining protein MreC